MGLGRIGGACHAARIDPNPFAGPVVPGCGLSGPMGALAVGPGLWIQGLATAEITEMRSRLEVALQIVGRDLDPDVITRALGQPPTFGVRRGEIQRPPAKGTAIQGVWGRSATGGEDSDINSQIRQLLSETADDLTVWRTISASYSGAMICGVFIFDGQYGMVVDEKSIQMMHDRRMIL